MDMPRPNGIYRGTERWNTMKKKTIVGWMMAALGLLGAGAVVVLRVWLMPALRDNDTGLFTSNNVVIILTLLMVVALAVLAILMRGTPGEEKADKGSLLLAMVALVAGVAFLFNGALDIWSVLRTDNMPADTARLLPILQWLQRVFCLLSGAALIHLGLLLASDKPTGMAQWSLLAPVVWMWLLLANYEMNAASMVRLTSGYFTLMTYIAELLFLFYFARYIAGVGKVGDGMMLLFSSAASLFAISTPVVQIVTHLMQDSAAYEAAGVADNMALDLVVGLLALTVSITLCQRFSAALAEESEGKEDVMESLGLISFADKAEVESEETETAE